MSLLDSFRRVEGRSLAFFTDDPNQFVDGALLQELKTVAKAERRNVRICLHDSPDAEYHDMIILERLGSYFPMHRHPTKAETIHIIEGTLEICLCDDQSNVSTRAYLNLHGGHLLWRIGKGQWHFNRPVSDYVIFHESKHGPYLGEAESEIWKWTPGPNLLSGGIDSWALKQ